MKKWLLGLAVAISFLLPGATSFAYITSWDMDLSKAGVVASVDGDLYVSYLSGVTSLGISNVGSIPATVVQSLGADGILNDGDTFTEYGFISQTTINGKTINYRTADLSQKLYLYAQFTGLAGSIDNYDNGIDGLDTTLSNYNTAIQDDRFDTTFVPYVGSISIYFGTAPGVVFQNLAELTVLAGGGQSPTLKAGAVANGSFDLTLGYSNILLTDFFLLPDGKTFEDYVAMYGPVGVKALVNTNAGILDLSDDGTNIVMQVENSGTFRTDIVPEPASVVLLGLGLGLLGFRRRK